MVSENFVKVILSRAVFHLLATRVALELADR